MEIRSPPLESTIGGSLLSAMLQKARRLIADVSVSMGPSARRDETTRMGTLYAISERALSAKASA